MERPIITTSLKGCKEVVIPERTGFFCRSNDPFDLAAQMEKMLLMSPETRINMGHEGRRWVTQKFAIEQVLQAYTQILDR